MKVNITLKLDVDLLRQIRIMARCLVGTTREISGQTQCSLFGVLAFTPYPDIVISGGKRDGPIGGSQS